MPNLHARIVRCRVEGHARAQAGSQNPDARIALPHQPVQASPQIDDGLPRGVDRPPNVARHVVIGALQFGRHTFGVIGHGHAQRTNAEAVQQFRQAHVPIGSGVPLG